MGSAESVWRVPPDHPAFAGHFPARPIVPGVVLLDHAIGLAQGLQGGPVDGWRVDQAKFLSPCGPGETLHFALEVSARGAIAFRVSCEGRAVASGSLVPPPR